MHESETYLKLYQSVLVKKLSSTLNITKKPITYIPRKYKNYVRLKKTNKKGKLATLVRLIQ